MALISIVIPVYNEEEVLGSSVSKVLDYAKRHFTDFEVVIADNASNDRTPGIGKMLSKTIKEVKYLRLEQKGRGRALKKAWSESKADIVCYMDVDLSTDISHLIPLISAIEKEGYDVAIGSRLSKRSSVHGRTLLREVFSMGYNVLIKTMFFTSFHDAQCGFKAVSRDVINKVIPLVKDNGWFFDTEMLIIAEKSGYKIKEIPVKWMDDPSSTVKVLKTAWDDFKGLVRLRATMPWRFKYKNRQ